MHYRLFRFHMFFLWFRHLFSEELLALLLVLLVFVTPAAAATRFLDRGLYMNSSLPNVTTSYTLTFGYATPLPVGSVDMLICNSPIPYDPCVPPAGLDASQAVLSSQTGESGFSIWSKSSNHIIITRAPGTPTTLSSSYTFDNIVNPSGTDDSFAIRLQSHSSTDATGPQIDFGSIEGQVTDALTIETQVPPILIFCVAKEVAENCETTTDNSYYTDLGELSPSSTLTTQSQMAVGTNATGGFAITANGTPPSAGTNVIGSSAVPTASTPGTNQFGINLVANSSPSVGSDPEGTWTNALPTADYSTPNLYSYVPGSVVAFAPNVSLMRKFTVSYILNSDKDLRAGVYTTTITYIASGRF